MATGTAMEIRESAKTKMTTPSSGPDQPDASTPATPPRFTSDATSEHRPYAEDGADHCDKGAAQDLAVTFDRAEPNPLQPNG